MSADSFHASVLILPNPQSSSPEHLAEIPRVNGNITFVTDITTNILTLYTGAASRGDDISGLLYVPLINTTSSCPNLLLLPANVTHKDDLPNANYDLIGFAPWISGACSALFLAAARKETSSVKGFVFFTTDEAADTIPGRGSDVWSGVEYRDVDFPVYAVSGRDGIPLLGKVAEYSGNMSDAWEARNLTSYYDPNDYARVYMEVNTGQRNPLPGLWLFLLVVLAVLIVIVGLTSLSMHWLQHQHRQRLRRRVAAGQVDLEALGIKRLSVPRKILDQFPIRVYVSETPVTSTPSPTPPAPVRRFLAPDPPLPPPPTRRYHTSTTHQRGFAQSQCPICLDDFMHGITQVRELPCLHVFHPECIDPFLERQSSLCPLCKASALPQGYVPNTLTNATVRRERNLRRMRARVEEGGGSRWWGWWRRRAPEEPEIETRMGIDMRETTSTPTSLIRPNRTMAGEGSSAHIPPSHEDEMAEVSARPKCRCPDQIIGPEGGS